MTQAEVLILIRRWIIANSNNEITADVLRPILEAILNQPNDQIGNIANLTTVDQTNTVAAINELVTKFTQSNFNIHTGTGTPYQTPPLEYSIGDFYIHDNGGIQGFYQFTGSAWVKITNRTNQAIDEVFFGLIPTAGSTTTEQEAVDFFNSTTFLVEENETLLLSGTGKVNGIPVYVSYFFKRNNISGVWGTGQVNGAITTEDLVLNLRESNIDMLEAEGEVIQLGDIGVSSPWNYVNTHVEPTAGAWSLITNVIYFFKYTTNGQQQTAMYEGPLPVQLGSNGNYVAVEGDFAIISDTSEVSKQYVDDQDIAVQNALMLELDRYILLTQKGAINGVATLNSQGVIPDSQLPPLSITDVITPAENTFTAFLTNNAAYTFEKGDVAVITLADGSVEHYLYKGGDKTLAGSYSRISATSIEISQVKGLQAHLDGIDVDLNTLTTAINQANLDINAVEDRVTTIENNLIPEAPNDGKPYSRQQLNWQEAPAKPRMVQILSGMLYDTANYGAFVHGVLDDYSNLETVAGAAYYNEVVLFRIGTAAELNFKVAVKDIFNFNADGVTINFREIIGTDEYGFGNGYLIADKAVFESQQGTYKVYDLVGHRSGSFVDYTTEKDLVYSYHRRTIQAGGITEETDPTVPAHVKAIAQIDIDDWDLAAGKRLTDVTITTPDPNTPNTRRFTFTFADATTIIRDTTVGSTVDLSKYLRVDAAQTFTDAEKTQGRANIGADKRGVVRAFSVAPTNQNFIDWESDILLVKGAVNFVLPAAGILPNGSRYFVKTNLVGTVNYSVADATVSIEYNDPDAIGYQSQRSEAWVLLQDNIYYISGEVG